MTDQTGNNTKPVIMQLLPAMEMGGVERSAVDVALAIKAAGYEALVVSAGGRMVHELERAGIRHIRAPVDSKNPWRIWKNAELLQKLIREHGVSLLHARSRAPAWSGWLACQRAGIPFVTTFHSTYNFSGRLKKFYNAVMVRGDYVIANSDFIRQHVMDNYDMPWSRLRVIQRGVDIDLYDPEKVQAARVVSLSTEWRLPDDVPVVMLPGRLTGWKGQKLLIEALARLDRKVRCLLVGSAQGRDAYVEELEALARVRDLRDSVHIVQNCRDLPAAYKLADVIVSASTQPEAFGRVTVEGQAMGRPVVAPDHGGAREQITHGVTGWLFRPGDADHLAQQLNKALSLSPAERANVHEAAITNARTHFTKKLMCDRTLSVYREVLGLPEEGATP